MPLAQVGILAEIDHVAVATIRGRKHDQTFTLMPGFNVLFDVLFLHHDVIIHAALFQQSGRDAFRAVLGHDEELTIHTQNGNSPSYQISSGGFCSIKR